MIKIVSRLSIDVLPFGVKNPRVDFAKIPLSDTDRAILNQSFESGALNWIAGKYIILRTAEKVTLACVVQLVQRINQLSGFAPPQRLRRQGNHAPTTNIVEPGIVSQIWRLAPMATGEYRLAACIAPYQNYPTLSDSVAVTFRFPRANRSLGLTADHYSQISSA